MDLLQSLLAEYGLWIVLLGTFLEGETIVVLAGFAAHEQLLNPYAVAAMAFAGSFAGDQMWFFLARRYRTHSFITKNTDHPAFRRALDLLEKYPTLFILSFRFIYGIRNISPVAIGLSKITALRFLLLNAVSAAVWAATFTALGFVFANTAQRMLGEIKKFEHIAVIIVIIMVLIYIVHRVVRRKFLKPQDEPGSDA